MKKVLLASVAALSVAGVASASVPGANKFTGFYLGADLGYGTGDADAKINTTKLELGAKGVRGGLHVGYGKQFDNRFYLGLEANGYLSGMKDSFTSGSNKIELKRNWGVGASLRPGIVFDNALAYAIVGFDYANLQAKGTDSSGTPFDNKKKRFGFVPGLGVELMATDHVKVGVEATHTFYKKIKDDLKLQATEFVARVSYKW